MYFQKIIRKAVSPKIMLLPVHTSELQSFADRCVVGNFSVLCLRDAHSAHHISLHVLGTSHPMDFFFLFFFGCRYNMPALHDLYFCQVRRDQEWWGLWRYMSDAAGLSAGRQQQVGDPQSVQINLIKNPSMFPVDVCSGAITSALSISQSSMDSLWSGRIIEIPQSFRWPLTKTTQAAF